MLVGDTALSLQIGHRRSNDIDLFSISSFDTESMFEFLQSKYDFKIQTRFQKSLCYFDDINFDADIQYQKDVIPWQEIHSRIIDMVQQPQNKFASFY
jgi:hypothetical protein